MTKQAKSERRRYPRVERMLPINIAANGYEFATSTQNLSCTGAYCHLDKYIPPFTRIAAKISMPIVTDERRENINVECKGVIVRSEDEKRGGFNVAIFFNGIRDAQRNKIAQYINQFLPNKSSASKKL